MVLVSIVVLVWCVLRLAEFVLSVVDTGELLARGAHEECRAQHVPLLLANVAVPALTVGYLAMATASGEVIAVTGVGAAALAVLVAAESLHWWAIRTLGRRWTTGVLVLPGETPVSRGPYRWLRHPGYAAGTVSAVTLPLVAGGWPVAILVAVLFAVVVTRRIRCEDHAWLAFGASGPTAA